MRRLTIALAGNPNSGKTTLFNTLTGSNQRTGNWPGVTVDRKEGAFAIDGTDVKVVDLPGIYSFSAYSLDEKVSRDFLLHDKPDLVVNIIDATNLERNLYLTAQLLEMKCPVIVALNMMDLVKKRKIRIDTKTLSEALGCPVIPIQANSKMGLDELKAGMLKANGKASATQIVYDAVVETAIQKLIPQFEAVAKTEKVDARWLTVKLLEDDELVQKIVGGAGKELVDTECDAISKHTGDDCDLVIADGRYGFINGITKKVVNRDAEVSRTVTEKLDKVVLNRFLGIPVFLVIMYIMFLITMNVGAPFIDFFDGLCGTIFVDGFRVLLEGMGSPEWLVALLADGIGGAIQTVATFIPPIGLIFLCLSFLEDSGYMARAAFVMDRLLRLIGLPGKAFIPMLVGLGCNVPAIMATRTLESKRDRLLSIMINPLISCGARIPIYALFAIVFFKNNGANMLFGLYFGGVVLAVLTGLLLRKTIIKGEMSSFVMELPPYHIPTMRGIGFHTWNRLKSFIIRAGKVIAVAVVILSFLNSIGTDGSFGHEGSQESVLSAIGKTITPVFTPMGVTEENWPATVGLFTGLFAKEAVVGTMDSLYDGMVTKEEITAATGQEEEEEEAFGFWGGIGDSFEAIPAGFEGFWGSVLDPLGLKAITEEGGDDDEAAAEEIGVNASTFTAMQKFFPSKAAAIAYLIFILIYAPCVAAIGAVYNETNLKWTIFSVSYLTGLAWVAATTFYQFSRLSVAPGEAIPWLIGCGVIVVVFLITMVRLGKAQVAESDEITV